MKVEFELHHHLMSSHQLAVIPNFYYGGYECDVFALNRNLYTTEYEIKTTKADYLKDFEKKQKKLILTNISHWSKDIKKHFQIADGERTNRFYFVIPEGLIKTGKITIPDYAGVMSYTISYESVWFKIVKTGPRLHNRKMSTDSIIHCLGRLNHRYYCQTRRHGFLKYESEGSLKVVQM